MLTPASKSDYTGPAPSTWTMDLWERQSPESLTVYARPSAPESALDEPDDGLHIVWLRLDHLAGKFR